MNQPMVPTAISNEQLGALIMALLQAEVAKQKGLPRWNTKPLPARMAGTKPPLAS